MSELPVGEELVGVGFAVLAAASLALQALCMRMGMRGEAVDGTSRALDALVVVSAVNLVVFVPVTLVVHYPTFDVGWLSVGAFASAGLFGFLLGRALHFESINLIGASRTEPIKSSQPLHATLIAVVVLGESVTSMHVAGIVLITVGIATISWETASSNPLNLSRRRLAVALLLPLLAALFYGIEPTLTSVGLDTGTPILIGAVIEAATGLTGLLLYRQVVGYTNSPSYLRSVFSRWYVAAGVGNTLFVLAYFRSLSVAPVAVVVPVVQSSPIIVIAVSLLFLQRYEKVTAKVVLSAVVVVAGAVVVTLHA
jgi:drug/metabolite transporter (DMT)-like permease